MNDPKDALQDDDLDALLRHAFEGPVADDGFVARLMPRLPPRPPRRFSWLLPAATLTGALLAWAALAPSPLLAAVVQEWRAAELGASSALLLALGAGLSLLGCAWALEEGS